MGLNQNVQEFRKISLFSMEDLHEDFERKRLRQLADDTFRIGCTKGFRYFSMYLRGREELLLKVQNEQVPLHPVDKCFYQETVTEECSDEDADDNSQGSYPEPKPLPRMCDSLIMSRNSQHSLSGLTFLGGLGLPPASPSETENTTESDSTLFLVGTYSRYKSPYVWVRSNHQRLVSFTDVRSVEDIDELKDSPLKLNSVSNWRYKDIRLWDILAEVVRINVEPCPRNPFAVDHAYFDTLPAAERVLATGAMVHFLNDLLLSGEHSYNTKVADDLNEVMRRHFKDLNTRLVTK